MTSQSIGRSVEHLAESFLSREGLLALERNYRSRFGEVDLIMRDADQIVFVEVRGRRSNRFGTPAETVTAKKQRRLALAAMDYLQRRRKYSQMPCRFDVIAVEIEQGGSRIEWIKNAFET